MSNWMTIAATAWWRGWDPVVCLSAECDSRYCNVKSERLGEGRGCWRKREGTRWWERRRGEWGERLNVLFLPPPLPSVPFQSREISKSGISMLNQKQKGGVKMRDLALRGRGWWRGVAVVLSDGPKGWAASWPCVWVPSLPPHFCFSLKNTLSFHKKVHKEILCFSRSTTEEEIVLSVVGGQAQARVESRRDVNSDIFRLPQQSFACACNLKNVRCQPVLMLWGRGLILEMFKNILPSFCKRKKKEEGRRVWVCLWNSF